MPGRYGLDLLYQIRSLGAEHGGDVPAIIITGLRDPDLESEISKGGFGYLAKPFTPIKLLNTIIQALSATCNKANVGRILYARSLGFVGSFFVAI